jgi:hypothetical protein
MPARPFRQNIDVVHQGNAKNRTVSPSARCGICNRTFGSGNSVVRVRTPGTAQQDCNYHKSCMVVWLSRQVDDLPIELSSFLSYKDQLLEEYSAL